MELTLPSGATVTIRDTFTRGDRMYALQGLRTVMQPDGTIVMDAAAQADVAGRILRRMIIGHTIPGVVQFHQASAELAELAMDGLADDDWMALEQAVEPWTRRVTRRDRTVFAHVRTGAVVEPQSPADTVKLGASPEFRRVGADEAPKAPTTQPGSPATPALPGPEATPPA